MNRLEEFLKELSELTKKYGLEIGGCGCCHSPWIFDLTCDRFAAEYLRYNKKEQKYKPGEEDEDEDEFEDDEDEDEDEDEAVYKAFCKQFLNADEKWELVKGLKG